jgi:isoquinoline 1-oxidoreductase alpha subunit
MTAAGLLAKKANPTDTDIDEAMRGNICRCGTYQAIRRAIHRAAQLQRASRGGAVRAGHAAAVEGGVA